MQLSKTLPNRHRVQRQIVELAVVDSAEAPGVQQRLARPFWDDAVPELETVFDAVAGPDELVRVDRLEVDLGNVGGDDWTAEFRQKLIAELARRLAQVKAESTVRGADAREAAAPSEPWQQFVFFLIHGRLPWWAARPVDGWSESLLGSSDAAGWSALRETAFSHPDARARLVESVADDFLDAAVARWSGLRHAAQVLEQWTPKSLPARTRRKWRRAFWRMVIDWVAAGGFRSPRAGPELVHDLLILRRTHVSDSEAPADRLPPQHEDRGVERPVRAAPDDDLPEPWRAWHMSQADAPTPRTAFDTPAGAPSSSHRAPWSFPPRDRLHPDPRARRVVEDEAIYLEGAGAVLLHPFFESLFRDRALLTGRSFRDDEARDRAVRLIGLLTFGTVDVPEYQLVLAKTLCGAPLEEPLEPLELDDDDLAACDALLRAVLEHWTALRSSSPAWLRQHFFLREGKLEPVDSGYLLTIERRAQDVLLTRLPWGFGVVALPWLAERIFVRWLD